MRPELFFLEITSYNNFVGIHHCLFSNTCSSKLLHLNSVFDAFMRGKVLLHYGQGNKLLSVLISLGLLKVVDMFLGPFL